jgi:plasmid stabilization system protein ParE
LDVNLFPEANAEAESAAFWYAKRSETAMLSFRRELDLAIDRIRESPLSRPEYLHGTRYQKLKRFPYLVVFRVKDDAIDVLAVAHTSRRTGYWKDRVT